MFIPILLNWIAYTGVGHLVHGSIEVCSDACEFKKLTRILSYKVGSLFGSFVWQFVLPTSLIMAIEFWRLVQKILL